MNYLIFASAVGPIGSGETGGVSHALEKLIWALDALGHRAQVLAPEGSILASPARLTLIQGACQPTLVADMGGDFYPIVPDSVLAHYGHYATQHTGSYDAIINLCHDWLPYYLTDFLPVPVFHCPNVAGINRVVTEQIRTTAKKYPGRVAALSHAQAASLGIERECYMLQHSVTLADYPFAEKSEPNHLICCARISPEKGIEHAAMIARASQKRLMLCGHQENADYFVQLMVEYGDVIDYRGFLNKHDLAREMGRASALLCTHQCIEAFGVVVIEALACGTPVITYDLGGPAEIITHGEVGYVVPVNDVAAAVEAVNNIQAIDRRACRTYCEQRFGETAYMDRVAGWLSL